MSQPVAQKVTQGKRIIVTEITIPVNGAEATIESLLPVRVTDSDKENITGIRLYAQVAAGTDRGAFLFGDVATETVGFCAAGSVFYAAALEAKDLFVESTDGSTVPATIEILLE